MLEWYNDGLSWFPNVKYLSSIDKDNRLINFDKRSKPYLKSPSDDEEQIMINTLLIEVMATIPISNDGKFDHDFFFEEVRKIERDEKEFDS